MNELTVIENDQFGEIRIFMDENNEPWFCGKDVLAALDYSKGSTPAVIFEAVPVQWKGIKRISHPWRGAENSTPDFLHSKFARCEHDEKGLQKMETFITYAYGVNTVRIFDGTQNLFSVHVGKSDEKMTLTFREVHSLRTWGNDDERGSVKLDRLLARVE